MSGHNSGAKTAPMTRREAAEKMWEATLDRLRKERPGPVSTLAAAYIWADEDTAGDYSMRFIEALAAAGYAVVKVADDA